jgi:Phage integrase family
VCGLRRSDVHLLLDSAPLGCAIARAHLHVVRREDNPNRAWAKSRRPRVVPLDFVAVQAFDAYEFERKRVPAASGSDFVLVNLFRAPVGAPMRPDAIGGLFTAASRRAGLETAVTPHQLRHAAGSNLLDAGGSLDEVQELLGSRLAVRDAGVCASGPGPAAGRGGRGSQSPRAGGGDLVTALLVPAPELPVRPAGVPAALVLGGGHPCDGAAGRLAGLIEPEFLAGAGWDPVARTLSPRADHRLLGWAVCQVAACGNKVDAIGGTCQACRRRPGTGGSPAKADARPACPAGAEPGACAVTGCGRVTRSMRQPLCESHRRHRGKLGLAVAEFTARPGVVPLPAFGTCQVAACSRQRSGSKSPPYCEQHAVRLRGQRRADPALDERRWRLTEPAIARDGTVSLAGLRDTLAVQVLLGLQQRCRHGSKTSMTDLAQICDHGRRAQAGALAELACPGAGNKAVLTRALTRFVYQALLDPEAEQAKDVWDLAAFGQNGHLDFTMISQPWLRQAAKRWAIDDLPRRRGRAGGTLQDRLKALARLSDSLRGGRGDGGNDPAALGRPGIDVFLNRLACLAGNGGLSEYARARTCQSAGRVLSRIRAIGLTRPGGVAAGLPDDVTLTASDIPAHPEEPEPGRDLPPEIMRQLCGRLDVLE